MWKAIAVDDNKLHLHEICSIIDWSDYDIEITDTFANGKQALEKLADIRPDIVLTDIMMPVMNGIELAQRMNEDFPECKIVFLSSADDFNAAQMALKLNVSEYLLKPLNAEEVGITISKITGKIASENAARNRMNALIRTIEENKGSLTSQLFHELLFSRLSEAELGSRLDTLQLPHLKERFVAVVDMQLSPHADTMDEYQVSLSVNGILSAYPSGALETYPLQTRMNEFVVVCFSAGSSEFRDALYAYCVGLHDRLVQETPVTISFSSVGRQLTGLPTLYREAEQANTAGFIQSGDLILSYSDIGSMNPFEKSMDLTRLHEEVNNVVYAADDTEIIRFLHTCFSLEIAQAAYAREYAKSMAYFILSNLSILLTNEHKNLMELFDEPFAVFHTIGECGSLSEISRWVEGVLRSVRRLLHQNEDSKDMLVQKIKAYIQENYTRDISLFDIADSVFYSVRQANYLFKSKTGMTIYEYIVEYRIEMAKKYLLTTKMKVKDIAEAVGYTSHPHFRLVFKKYTGLSPGEFKQKNV